MSDNIIPIGNIYYGEYDMDLLVMFVELTALRQLLPV